jgi:hypothetical protein
VPWKADHGHLQNGSYSGEPILSSTTHRSSGTSGLFDFGNNASVFATDQFV